MRIPLLLAAPNPPKNPRGTLRTKAHGQLMTKNIKALEIHSLTPPKPRIGGRNAKAVAAATTIGV